MDAAEFCIPVTHREELLSSGTKQRVFLVRDVLSDSTEIAQKLEECTKESAARGPLVITSCFDVFYSVVENFSKLDKDVRVDAWRIASGALLKLCEEVPVAIETGDCTEKNEIRNIVKMWTYIVYQLVEAFEVEESKPDMLTTISGKVRKGKKKQAAVRSPHALNWMAEVGSMLQVIGSLLDIELWRLWNPPSPTTMDDYSSLIANCCYKILENPNAVKDKKIKEPLLNVLGVLLKYFNQTLSMSLKFVQLIQHFEHLASPLAEALHFFQSSHGCQSVTSDVIREIGRQSPRDLVMDTSGAKQFATFIVEVTQLLPDAVFPSLTCLLPHLGYESYTMRNGVLEVLGETVIRKLKPDQLDDKLRRTRDDCLDRLEGHLHDVNAFVRSRCLQVWQRLSTANQIPVKRLEGVLEAVTGRLQDKSSMVRKNALQFLSITLQRNPYAPTLNEADFSEKLKEAEIELRQLLPEEIGQEPGPESELAEQEESEACGRRDDPQVRRAAELTLIVKYLQDSLVFTRLMSSCLPTVILLLGSKVNTDVTEAVEFLCTCLEFGLPRAESGVRKALGLVWSEESSIRDLIVATYTRLYLSPDKSASGSTEVICSGLLKLAEDLTMGDYISLEELVTLMVRGDLISSAVINRMWNIVAGEAPGYAPNKVNYALIILSMVANGNPSVISNHFDVLITRGLQSPLNDLSLARQTCVALQKMVTLEKKKGAVSSTPPFRLPQDHALFQRLCDIAVNEVVTDAHSQWVPFAEKAISTIYLLAEQPHRICANLLGNIRRAILPSNTTAVTGEVADLSNGFDPESMSTQNPDHPPPAPSLRDPFSTGSVDAVHLARFLHALGCVAHQQLIHLEHSIYREMKRRSYQQDHAPTTPSTARKTPRSAKSTSAEARAPKEVDLEEEEALLGGAVDDDEFDLIKKVCEEELLDGSASLLGHYAPLVVTMCTDQGRYSCGVLQASATLALSKFMLISSKFCAQHLRLLFTILQKSPEPIVRANTIVAVGDLTFRFPNLIEPWTSNLYDRLTDSCVSVRKNTLTVLSHLILNDMIKVKGQISNVALCLEDEDLRIRDLAKLFFNELSKKGNAIYNVLPDIISRLSSSEERVSSEVFNSVMKYLLSFVQKEKQSESLVEKLCHRFRGCRSQSQSCDLAQCLAQLTFSEKCFRKLYENMASYQDKLGNETVFGIFISILTKCKKFAKPEFKATVEELEVKINEIHCKLNGTEATSNATQSQSTSDMPVTKNTRSKTVRKTSKRQALKDIANSNESDEEEYVPQSIQKVISTSAKTLRSTRHINRRTQQKARLVFSSESESESEGGNAEELRRRILCDESDSENMSTEKELV